MLTYVVSTRSARSLGYFSRNDRGVAAGCYVLVARLPVNIVIPRPAHVASAIPGPDARLLDTSGHVVTSLGPIEQVKPTEIGTSAVLKHLILTHVLRAAFAI